MTRGGTVAKGALLVAGTTIGGGMLAMPVMSSLAGFFPATILFIICWAFMAATGLLFLEACLWMHEDTNFVSMAKKTLGLWGESAAWVMYLFLFYVLSLAYVVGCGKLTWLLLESYIPEWAGSVIFVLLFGPLVYFGARLVGRINILLMGGLAISYIAFVYLGYKYVDFDNLREHNWQLSLRILPVAFTAFGFQGIVPTLTRYLDFDKVKVRNAILLGSFIPLLVFIIWHWLIMGIIPREGAGGLLEALERGDTAVQPLKNLLDSRTVYVFSEFFAFFALSTSFLGVTLGLRDFLADGIGVEKDSKGRFFLCSLIFIPVTAAAIFYPDIFIELIGIAGGYGASLLLGLLPILMVWSGRYRLRLPGEKILFGGKPLLVAMTAFALFQVVIVTMHLTGLY
jgi:tyrosine-specific transport protein